MENFGNSSDFAVIDLGELMKSELPIQEHKEFSRVSDEVKHALSESKLVYLINHGISTELLKEIFALSKELFALPLDVKESYRAQSMYDFHGYLPLNSEIVYKTVVECRESFNIIGSNRKLPDDEIPGFSVGFEKLTEKFLKVTEVFLTLVASGLGLDKDFFINCHKFVMKDHEVNTSIFRALRYPPIIEDPHPGIMRCSQHTDFGTLTFLIEENEGGLQAQNKNGDWINAVHVPGAIILNTADLLDIWTSGRYKKTVHRVAVPAECHIRNSSRYSLAFFVQPDFQTVVRPLFALPGTEVKEYIAGEYIANRVKYHSFS